MSKLVTLCLLKRSSHLHLGKMKSPQINPTKLRGGDCHQAQQPGEVQIFRRPRWENPNVKMSSLQAYQVPWSTGWGEDLVDESLRYFSACKVRCLWICMDLFVLNLNLGAVADLIGFEHWSVHVFFFRESWWISCRSHKVYTSKTCLDDVAKQYESTAVCFFVVCFFQFCQSIKVWKEMKVSSICPWRKTVLLWFTAWPNHPCGDWHPGWDSNIYVSR